MRCECVNHTEKDLYTLTKEGSLLTVKYRNMILCLQCKDKDSGNSMEPTSTVHGVMLQCNVQCNLCVQIIENI